MLHPKSLVFATPEVVDGAPVLAIVCSPGFSMDDEAEGWMFLHVNDTVPDDADLRFFEQIPELDVATRTIVESSTPGIYRRESEFASFEFELG